MKTIAFILVSFLLQAGVVRAEVSCKNQKQIDEATQLLIVSQRLNIYLIDQSASEQEICFQLGQLSEAHKGFSRIVKALNAPVSMDNFVALGSLSVLVPRLYGFCSSQAVGVSKGDRSALRKALEGLDQPTKQLLDIRACR